MQNQTDFFQVLAGRHMYPLYALFFISVGLYLQNRKRLKNAKLKLSDIVNEILGSQAEVNSEPDANIIQQKLIDAFRNDKGFFDAGIIRYESDAIVPCFSGFTIILSNHFNAHRLISEKLNRDGKDLIIKLPGKTLLMKYLINNYWAVVILKPLLFPLIRKK